MSLFLVTDIESGAFCNCAMLTSVTIPGEWEFSHLFGENTSIREVVVSPGSKTISDDAFEGCRDLISVTVPDSVTNIGCWAFYDCKSLASVTVPSSVV